MPTLNHLIERGHDIVGVLTQPDAPTGRGRRLQPSHVSARAHALGLPVLAPERAADATDEIRALAPEIAVVVAYGQLLRPELLAVPTHGWINLHFSVLPRWRGAAPVQRAILAGDRHTGSTVFSLVPELDAGPVWAVSRTHIGERESAGELLGRLARDGGAVVDEAIGRIAAGESPVAQPADGVTHAAKLTPRDGHLDLGRPACELDRVIRGCTPAPGAWTTFRGERFKVLEAVPVALDARPGQLVATKNDLVVGTGNGGLRLLRVQAFGKKAMAGADWARGVSLGDEGLGS